MKNYTYVHYLKVVSKRYEGDYDEDEVHTYLYSAFSNEHKEDDKYPSVMFQYDLSPMTVLSKYHSQPFYHFITNFCAIIGGVFSIIGIIDRCFRLLRQIQQENSLSIIVCVCVHMRQCVIR